METERNKKLISDILSASNRIARNSRYGVGDHIVCSESATRAFEIYNNLIKSRKRDTTIDDILKDE